MQKSISELIDELFSSKSEDKRAKWLNTFLENEYETVEDLRGMNQGDWESIERDVPRKVLSDIKNYISKDSETEQNPEKVHETTKKETSIPTEYVLQDFEVQAIVSMINRETPVQEIVKNLGAQPGSLRQAAIERRAKTLIRPPQPYPQNCKKIQPRKTQQEILPLFHYPSKEIAGRKYYTFIVIGQTGTGKTTLMDAFVNKLTGMNYHDNWRWKLVDESHMNHLNNNDSKTSTITTYYINDVENKFNVKLIDTPGFGDTRGMQADDEITNLFETLFREIQSIDYILLTVKSTETRLAGASSKYIYNRVQELFGKNAASRFILMCTFSDDKKPECVKDKGLEISWKKYFQFNNSALYTPSTSASQTTGFYWKMGMESIQLFADYIKQQNAQPLSLTLSSEVLQTRKYLQTYIETAQKSLKQAWEELDHAKQSFKSLQENQKKIEENGQYEEDIQKSRIDYSPLNGVYQMCLDCQSTCCQYCRWPNGSNESACTYFNGGRNCPVCPGKCPKSRHARATELITKVFYTEKKTIDIKKRCFDEGLSNVQMYYKIYQEKVKKITDLTAEVWRLTQQIKAGISQLEKTALKPKIFSDRDFYMQMIDAERETRADGWTTRIEYIKKAMKRSEDLSKLERSQTLQDLFPELKQLEEQQKTVSEAKNKSKKDSKQKDCQIY